MEDQQKDRDNTCFLNREVRERKKTALDIVKVLLRERAMKQTDLAYKMGISKQALHHYLSGYWATPTQIKIKVAQALEVDSSVIWDLN